MSTAAFSEAFAAGALKRILRTLGALFLLGAAALWFSLGWKAAASFALGAAVAAINFQWLQFSVQKMVAGFLQQQKKRERGIWYKLLARYVFVAVVVYVIFKSYLLFVPAFIIGLLLPVLACMCEAVYEVYVAFRHAE